MSKPMRNTPQTDETTRQNSTNNGTVLAFRIAAFGAIRRAAELARQADHNARVARFGGYELDGHASEAIAECLRIAIRAAIGSDKR